MNPITMFGIVLMIVSIGLALREDRSIRGSKMLAGEVVELVKRVHGEGVGYSPRIRFIAPNGERREFIEPVSPSAPAFTPGERCVLLYDLRTAEARLFEFSYRFGYAWFLFAAGFALALAGVGYTYGDRAMLWFYTRR